MGRISDGGQRHAAVDILFLSPLALPRRGGAVPGRFSGDRPGPHWRGSGGAFSVADHTLSIRSGRDNPVLYLDGKNWKNYRVGFELIRPTGSRFDLYVGWRYPEFVKLVFSPPSPGTLKFVTAGGETAAEFDYTGKVDAKGPLKLEVDILGDTVSAS